MRSLESSRRPGRPSPDDDTLSANRDTLVWLLSVFWGEVGWELPRARTLEELQRALGPVKVHPYEHHLTSFLRPTSVTATAKEIRIERKALGTVVEKLRKLQQENDSSVATSSLAELAMLQTQTQQYAPMLPDLVRAWGKLMNARKALEIARNGENALQEKLKDKEAGFAQNELLNFITKPKYARNPLGLANAMAGLPEMTWRQSYERCACIPCQQWPNFQYKLFQTVARIWKCCAFHPDISPTKTFLYEIEKLPKNVLESVREPGTDTVKKVRIENSMRSHFSENWRRLRLAIEETVGADVDSERVPFLIFSGFGRNLAKPRSAQDQILDAREEIK